VLRGIDAAFDRYDLRPAKTKKINSLAYCSQEVLAAAEDMKEAAVGAGDSGSETKPRARQGFEPETVASFLNRNADALEALKSIEGSEAVRPLVHDTATTLRQLAEQIGGKSAHRLEDLERRLTVLEEKLFAVLLTSTPDEEIVAVRAEADRDLAPYRRKMSGVQIDQLHKQYVQKRLLEKYGLPRLSLFYM